MRKAKRVKLEDLVQKCGHSYGKKETLLNLATNRFQLNRPPCVGEIMRLIRECQPKSLEEWDAWYFENATTKSREPSRITRDSIREIGERLFAKLEEFVIPEMKEAIATITEADCIDYVYNLVIRRTYDGYITEKSVVTDKLAFKFPDIEFKESDPQLDHAGDVDYVAVVGKYQFGIQVKPITVDTSIASYSISSRMQKSFDAFTKKYGGKVFIVKSKKEGDSKAIVNKDVIVEIEAEIKRLRELQYTK